MWSSEWVSQRREVATLRKALPAWREAKGRIEALVRLAKKHGATDDEVARALKIKWTQRDLADATGGDVSAQLIGMIEAGDRQPRRANADLIAAALGVDVEAFAFVYPDALVETVADVQQEQATAARKDKNGAAA